MFSALQLPRIQKGFSLIEMLLVLGVLAVLLIGAFVVYPKVQAANQAKNEIANLNYIKASINNLYASKGGNYEGLTTSLANQARAFPSSMNSGVYTGEAILNSFGGGVSIVDVAASNARTFNIYYRNVPENVCLSLVAGASGNFKDITVGGNSVYKKVNGTSSFDIEEAAKNCYGLRGVVFISD